MRTRGFRVVYQMAAHNITPGAKSVSRCQRQKVTSKSAKLLDEEKGRRRLSHLVNPNRCQRMTQLTV
ncbi:hypothetical protein TNCV_3296101 [Trichonephila clavipes]|uniref:Uncharacterized protein n=1 Tax=Trichonephila clavipes TaxID=2585209 RepID=A0A8X6T788_TRICX|nr:hypothetical protein TNCV_3296101 [Trichonephila clavipes]